MATVTPHDGATAIGRLASWIGEVTARLDPGSGWYGEFLRRDPEGMRACLDGTALAPRDVLESLLHDLAAIRGPQTAAEAGRRAAELRRAAAAEYDARPGGAEELRHLLAAAAAQRSSSEAALRTLSARLTAAGDPAEAEFLTRELTWTQDDLSRAGSRCDDLAARLASLPERRPAPPAAGPGDPLARPAPVRGPGSGPAPVRAPAPAPVRAPAPAPEGPPPHAAQAPWPPASEGATGPERHRPEPHRPEPHRSESYRPEPPARPGRGEPQGTHGTDPAVDPAAGPAEAAAARRWLRRPARRTGGARHAGAEGGGPAVAAELPDLGGVSPRGARFGPPADRAATARDTPPDPSPAAAPAPAPVRDPSPTRPEPATAPRPGQAPWPGPDTRPPTRPPAGTGPEPHPHPAAARPTPQPPPPPRAAPHDVADVVAELIALRAQGRSGEAHVLLCEVAAWPAEALPGLARELERAGLGADWATLLWEAAASLPPDRLAAAAAALGTAGRDADRARLLRQGVARPAAEIAEAALALDAAGRRAEADLLLSAFVRVRSAEDVARLARRAPGSLAPRLLDAAGRVSAACRHGLVHALRVAGLKADRS
ncbi:hypothetical protein [Streptomyces sp. NPDC089799]|uniref:hypothetical protein n=1 Tax=Streptomyces sp. NPDC089799 TaxID=3155066 RepID=UPI003437A920